MLNSLLKHFTDSSFIVPTISLNRSTRRLKSSDANLLSVPRFSLYTMGGRSFCVAVPALLNFLFTILAVFFFYRSKFSASLKTFPFYTKVLFLLFCRIFTHVCINFKIVYFSNVNDYIMYSSCYYHYFRMRMQ